MQDQYFLEFVQFLDEGLWYISIYNDGNNSQEVVYSSFITESASNNDICSFLWLNLLASFANSNAISLPPIPTWAGIQCRMQLFSNGSSWNLYYEDIAVNIPNTLDLKAQGIKVYLNQNKAINIYNMEKWKQTCENLNPRNPNSKLWNLAKQIDRVQPQTEKTNMIKNTDGTPATNDKIAANLLGNSYQISSRIKVEKGPKDYS
ncbi:hypothetical protein LAZ67_9000762 [Cordylochernes scorpioides]|uniref:Teneurin-1-4-like galactose-binding domain-containing protein n=1 Tax=Cordylochernes scorpioides TaxID=51811 RepID=A0ABY6KT69_9ARAC|nr:hypothetical protein LAZ67_9000762 [Cordylochernes scorpioides]